jgi:hypothetical protein
MNPSMRSLIVLILLLIAGTPRAAERVPTALVSKDSLVFRVPATSLDEIWEIRFPVTRENGWAADGTAFISIYDHTIPEFMRKNGVAEERVLDFTWTGDTKECRFPWLTPILKDGAVVFTIRGGAAERFARIRPLSAILHGAHPDGTRYQAPVAVTYQKDPREVQARALSGPFTPDEYAIYQTVIDRAWPYASDTGPDFIVLSPTNSLFVVPPEELWVSFEPAMLHAIAELHPHDDTAADFIANWPVRMDLSSLAPLGYEIVDAGPYWERRKERLGRHRRDLLDVTMIGFNDARDQALVHLWAHDGELVRLDKIDGDWLVTGRARTIRGGD